MELADEAGGEVTVYTTSDIDLMAELTDAFEDAYDIDMSVFKTSREGLLTRVAEESKAGFRGADVIETQPDQSDDAQPGRGLSLRISPPASQG